MVTNRSVDSSTFGHYPLSITKDWRMDIRSVTYNADSAPTNASVTANSSQDVDLETTFSNQYQMDRHWSYDPDTDILTDITTSTKSNGDEEEVVSYGAVDPFLGSPLSPFRWLGPFNGTLPNP